MQETPSGLAGTKPTRGFRWSALVGWLVLAGAVAISIIALAGGTISETNLIAYSVYPLAAFGFGLATVIASRALRSNPSGVMRNLAPLAYGLLGALLAAIGRWVFFEYFWRYF